MAAVVAAARGALIGTGTLLLLAAAAPYLLGTLVTPEPPVLDPRHAPLVSAALGMLALAGVINPRRMPRLRNITAAAAAGMILATAAALALVYAPGLLRSGIGVPEGPRLLLVAAPAAIVVAVAAAWVCATPAVASSRVAGRVSAAAELAILGGITGAFAAIVVVGMLQDAPFSWDESAYAITTRHWLQGGPLTGTGVTRPPMLPILGLVPLAIGTQEWLFRLVGLLFGMGLVVAVWLLARSMASAGAGTGARGATGPGPGANAGAGLLCGLLVASAPSLQIDAGLFLTDVPATVLLVLLLAGVWHAFNGSQPPGWRLLWLAPLAAAAFYTRYGAIVPLVAIAVTVPLLWPAQVRTSWRPVLATVVLVGLLLVPHGVFAAIQRGSPLGIVLVAQDAAAGDSFASGLVQYLAWLPTELMGFVPGLAAVLGLVVGVSHLVRVTARRGWDARSRAFGLLVIPALAHGLLLGLVALPQQRYLFLPMVLLVVAGGIAVGQAGAGRGRVGRVAAGVVAGVGVVALVWSGVSMPSRAAGRTAFLEWERSAGLLIRDRGEGSCSVLAADYPQLSWYSGCPAYNFANVDQPGRERLLTGRHRFMVLRRDGKFQPTGSVLDAYLSRVEPEPIAELRNRDGHVVATVYRFAEP